MVKTIEQVSIIDAYNNVHEIANLKTSLVKIVNTFLKSENFKSYYINIYKERFAGPLIIKFMKENFGI
jgi:hypothetical protein